jgi:hypothetical protein
MSVPGIGPIISSAVVAAVGNGAGFRQGRDFDAWLGLVPKQESTGDRTVLGKISKRGNKYLRTLFVQAADVVLARRPSAAMRGLWPWIEQASKRLHRNMLAIALANKLARICLGGSRAWPGLSAEDHHPCGMTKARSGSPRGWLHGEGGPLWFNQWCPCALPPLEGDQRHASATGVDVKVGVEGTAAEPGSDSSQAAGPLISRPLRPYRLGFSGHQCRGALADFGPNARNRLVAGRRERSPSRNRINRINRDQQINRINDRPFTARLTLLVQGEGSPLCLVVWLFTACSRRRPPSVQKQFRRTRQRRRAMSAIGGKAENICSL